MDPEECAALVSIMRNQARFCGINILTYRLEAGRLSMLVSCPIREHHLKFFEDAENEAAGSGERRLLRHLRNLYSKAHVDELEATLEELRQQGEDVQPLIERYTHRIGIPRKFAEGVNEAFTRWIRKNRRQIYDKLEGSVCRKGITQTYVEQLLKQRDTAMRMDRDAAKYDDGQEPRDYWCGYSDALRGDEDALDGLRELMRSPANSAQDIKDLGYCSQRVLTQYKKLQPFTADRERKSTEQALSASRIFGKEFKETPVEDAPHLAAPYQLTGKWIKLCLIGFLLAATAVGALMISNQRREKLEAQKEAQNEAKRNKLIAAEYALQKADEQKEDKLGMVTALLYKHEARQLAADFAKSSDPTLRLKMCRDPEEVEKRLSSYPPQAVNEPANDVIFMDVVNLGGVTTARFFIKFNDETSRLLCIVATTDGLRVDWDCYARYNTKAWPELLNGTVKSAELRIFAQRSDYHSYEYRDDTQWSCFELLSPDFDQSLYAYAARGTTTAKILEAAMPKGGPDKKVQLTLQISSVDDGHERKQFTIDRIHAFGWVRGEMDVEDSYRAKIQQLGQVESEN